MQRGLDTAGLVRVHVLDEGLAPCWDSVNGGNAATRQLLVDRVRDYVGEAGFEPPVLAADDVALDTLLAASAAGVSAAGSAPPSPAAQASITTAAAAAPKAAGQGPAAARGQRRTCRGSVHVDQQQRHGVACRSVSTSPAGVTTSCP